MDVSSQTMMTEFILYNNWANQQVLQACQNLSEEQLAAVISGAYGTIRATLEHIIQGETFYVKLLAGSCPPPLFNWEDQPSLAELTVYAAQIGTVLLAWLNVSAPPILSLKKTEVSSFATRRWRCSSRSSTTASSTVPTSPLSSMKV
jgi:uncharacterized damage-inducible protein DinB